MANLGQFVSIVCSFRAQFHQIIERRKHPLPFQPILSIPAGSGNQGGHSATITLEALEMENLGRSLE
jgi:hypothetical protein